MRTRIDADKKMTQGFHQYTVGEMATMLNMPAPTIRFYDSQGAVVPKRDDENQYRRYTVVDGNYLLKLKELKNVGARVSDATFLLNEATLPDYLKGFRAVEAELTERLALELQLLEGLRRQIALIEQLDTALNSITIERRPALWRYNHQNADHFETGAGHSEARDAWTNYTPAAYLSFMFAQEDAKHTLKWGFALEDAFMEDCALKNLQHSKLYPAAMCIRYIFATENEVFLKYSHMKPAIDFMQKHLFLLAGDIIGRSLARVMGENNAVLHYYEAWLPISDV